VGCQVRQLRAEGSEKTFREVATVAKTDTRQIRRTIKRTGVVELVTEITSSYDVLLSAISAVAA
jgi:hypothetical protein